MNSGKTKTYTVLEETLERLKALYNDENRQSGIVQRIAVKPQWNVLVATSQQCGMSLNFSGKHNIYGSPEADIEKLRSLLGKSLFSLVEENLFSSEIQHRSIAIAALSALSQPFLDNTLLTQRGFFIQENKFAPAGMLSKKDVVAVVGYGGIVEGIIGKCRELHITDMRPQDTFRSTIIGQTIEYGPKNIFIHSENENKNVLVKADVVIITGSSLVNATFDELMSYSQHARLRGIYGPSSAMIPDAFFDIGVDFISLHRIIDAARFEYDMMNAVDMEAALKKFQQPCIICKKALNDNEALSTN